MALRRIIMIPFTFSVSKISDIRICLYTQSSSNRNFDRKIIHKNSTTHRIRRCTFHSDIVMSILRNSDRIHNFLILSSGNKSIFHFIYRHIHSIGNRRITQEYFKALSVLFRCRITADYQPSTIEECKIISPGRDFNTS